MLSLQLHELVPFESIRFYGHRTLHNKECSRLWLLLAPLYEIRIAEKSGSGKLEFWTEKLKLIKEQDNQ